MQEIRSLVDKIESSEDFKSIKDQLYLCSFFRMFDNNHEILQIHYYNKDKDNIVSFIIEDDKVRTEESKVFREKDEEVEELKLDQVKVNEKQALEMLEKLMKEKYQGELPVKKIVILQKVKVPLWNLTFLSDTMNIINVKINAENSEIISESRTSALSFRGN